MAVVNIMRTRKTAEIEEDILEDPIKIIFDTDTFSDYNQSDDPGINYSECTLNYEEYRRFDLTQKSESHILPSSRIIPNSDSICQIKQAVIKIVDFNKYPWYFTKYTALILKKRKELTNDPYFNCKDAKISNMQHKKIIPADSVTQNNNQNDNTPKVNSNISVKIIYDNNKKEWVVKNKEDNELKKNDLELRKAIRQKNVSGIDFKKNRGLVGLTVKQKLMPNEENVTPNVKESPTYKSKKSGEGKRNLSGKNKKSVKCINSSSKQKFGIERFLYKKISTTELNSGDKNSPRVNLTCDTTRDPEKTSKPLTNNKNESTASIMQKDLEPQSELCIDTPEIYKSSKSVALTKPAAITQVTEVKLGTEKISDETIKIHNIHHVSASTNINKPLNETKNEINAVLNGTSKIKVVRPSSREQINTDSDYQLQPRIPNYNNQNSEFPMAFTNFNSQIRHRLPIHRLPATNRLYFSNNLSYPQVRETFSWQQNLPNSRMDYTLNRVFTSYAAFTRPVPPRNRFPTPQIASTNQIRPQYYEILAPGECNSINNTRNIDNIKNVIPTTNNICELKDLTETESANSYRVNSSMTTHTQGVVTKTQNKTNRTTELKIEKSVVHKRSCVTDVNTINQRTDLPTKKLKLENRPDIEPKDFNKKPAELSVNEYSPPILPIPSYDIILSLLKSRHQSRRYLKIPNDDNDNPNKDDIHTENNKRETVTENVLDSNDISNVRKISLAEYKRRASLNNS